DAGDDDASSIDASVPSIDAAEPVVTVTVLAADGSGVPSPNVPVVFLEADGSLTKETVTDAEGKAQAKVKDGAGAPAISDVADTDHRLETILGVKPGDTLTIGNFYNGTAAGTFTVSFLEGPPGTTTAYAAYGPCGGQKYDVPQEIHAGKRPAPKG